MDFSYSTFFYSVLYEKEKKKKKKEKRNIRILFFFFFSLHFAQKEKSRISFLNRNKDTFISSPFFHVDRAHRTMEGREWTMSDKEDTNFSTGTTTTDGWPHARIW